MIKKIPLLILSLFCMQQISATPYHHSHNKNQEIIGPVDHWSALNRLKKAYIYYTKLDGKGHYKKKKELVRNGQQISQFFENLVNGRIKLRGGIVIRGRMLPRGRYYLFLDGDDVKISRNRPAGGWQTLRR